MAIQRIAPDAILNQTNLAGVLDAINDDPDDNLGTWLTSPAIPAPAAQVFQLRDTLAGSGYRMDTGAADAAAYFHNAGSVSGWIVGTTAINRWSLLDYNTEKTAATFTLTAAPTTLPITTAGAGDYFRSASVLTGDFAAANWTVVLNVMSHTANMNGRGRMGYRLWRSTDPNGANATAITGWLYGTTTTANVTTTTARDVGGVIAPGAFSLNGEYLFVQIVWQTTTAGTNATGDLNLRRGGSITTAAFTPKEPNGAIAVSFPTPPRPLVAATTQELRFRLRKKGTGANPSYIARVRENGTVRVSSGLTDVSAADPGIVLVYTFTTANLTTDPTNGSGVEAEFEFTNTPGASIEIEAVEWNASITDPPAVALQRTASSWIRATGESRRVSRDVRTNQAWFRGTGQANRISRDVRTSEAYARMSGQANRIKRVVRSVSSHIAVAAGVTRTSEKTRNAASWFRGSGVASYAKGMSLSARSYFLAAGEATRSPLIQAREAVSTFTSYAESTRAVTQAREAASSFLAWSDASRTSSQFLEAVGFLIARASAIRSTSKSRTARSYGKATTYASRVISGVRSAESVARMAGVARGVQQATRTSRAYGRFEAFSTRSTVVALYRTAYSWFTSDARSKRVASAFATAESYLTAAAEAFRFTRQHRDTESGGGFGGSASAIRSQHRTARSTSTFDAEAHMVFKTGPAWYPFEWMDMVVKVAPKRDMVVNVAHKREAVVSVLPKREAVVDVADKRDMVVTVAPKRDAVVTVITD